MLMILLIVYIVDGFFGCWLSGEWLLMDCLFIVDNVDIF